MFLAVAATMIVTAMTVVPMTVVLIKVELVSRAVRPIGWVVWVIRIVMVVRARLIRHVNHCGLAGIRVVYYRPSGLCRRYSKYNQCCRQNQEVKFIHFDLLDLIRQRVPRRIVLFLPGYPQT